MYARLLGLLLFACQIISHGLSATPANRNLVERQRSSINRTAPLPNGYVTFPEVQAAFKVHQENTTWHEARVRCSEEGAHLAIADSVEKIKRINDLKPAAFKWIHVGFYRPTDTNNWLRVDNGFPTTSIPWLRDDPDGTGDCAGISIFADALVRYQCHWGDEWFACEIPI